MNTLHIYRSKPDDIVNKLVESIVEKNKVDVIRLYQDNVDWKQLVESIFYYDKVICWW
jgi:hypothetical protein